MGTQDVKILLKVIKERRSIRAFKDKKIPDEMIDDLIEALIWAPSAGNLQSRFFYFVFNRELKLKLARAALEQYFISEAPLAIVCCADMKIEWRYGRRGKELYTLQDVAASIQNLMLLAHSMGLGTCWVGAFDEEKVRRIMDLPKNLRPVAIVPVGYPAESPSPPERVKRDDAIKIIH